MSIPASNARANLFRLIEQVNDDQEPVVITSNSGNAILLSESAWENMLELQYLLSTPANRDWLQESMAQADQGRVRSLDLPLSISKNLHAPKVVAKPAAKVASKGAIKPAQKKSIKAAAKSAR